MAKLGLKLFTTIALCWVFAFLCTSPVHAQSWSNGYAFRRAITIDHTKISNTDQTNFPVLFSGTYSFLASTANGGDVTSASGFDIIFTSDSAGNTPLAFEQESYAPTTGAVNYWVKVPTLSHTADTVIYVFYGNGSVTTDQSNKAGTWDSNYKGVWHLATGSPVSGTDSTSNGYNLTNNHGVSAASGKIDGAAGFDGSTNYLSNSSLSIPAGSSITISFWNFVTTANLQSASAFSIGGSDAPNRIQADSPWSDSTIYWDYGTYTSGRVNSSYANYLNTWAHVVLEYDSSTAKHSIYLNGTLVTSSTNSSAPQSAQTGVYIGAWPTSSPPYFEHGLIDEFRVSTIARSPDWVGTEYNNQSNPASFYAVSNPDVNGLGGATTPYVAGLGPNSGPITTPVSILGANFGATQGASNVTFNGVQATPAAWSSSAILVSVPTTATSGSVVVNVSGVASNSQTFTVTTAPGITGLSPSSGIVGNQVTINGVNFGTSQGSSTVTLSGVNCPVVSWSSSSITVVVPSGASSGPFIVTVGGQSGSSTTFTLQALPPGWSDLDIGLVGIAGSATYSNGAFTVTGSGAGIWNGSDQFHFVYQPLTGDGTIVARVVSLQGATTYANVAVMIRESLNANATNASAGYSPQSPTIVFYDDRTSTGGSTVQVNHINASVPYWVKAVRSGGSFSAYASADGQNWVQVGTTQTINMAQSVDMGLAVSNSSNTALVTAVFDNVSVSSSASPAPLITGVSATTGSIGSQVVIKGLNFGALQGNCQVVLGGLPTTINSWSATSITATIPAGATTGYLVVSVAPAMNDSNPVSFLVTPNPLPPDWLDLDIGAVGIAGSATYSNGAFTVAGSGAAIWNGSDQFHFVYQPLTGDGTIVARVVSLQGATTYANVAVMIRESLNANATNASAGYSPQSPTIVFYDDRTSTGGSTVQVNHINASVPYWVKAVRSGGSFSAYASADGQNWVQVGTTQTINMAQSVDMGLAVSNSSNTALVTAVFDNVSFSSFNGGLGGIWGSVTKASDGTSVVGAQIKISQLNTLKANLTSDVNGRFSVANLSPGAYDVQVSASGCGTSSTAGVVVLPLANTSLNVSLTSPGTITGKVTQADGVTPISGATVQAIVGVSSPAFATTDSSGNFTIGTLGAGSYQVQATATGYVPATQSASVTANSTTTVNFILQGPGSGAVNYVYDALGRLVGVINPSGDTATYGYDAVGNLLSISRHSSSQLSIITFTPGTGGVGTAVTIYGTGFSATGSQNAVQFNGVTAVVQSASATQLLVTVPSGATTGQITVTTSAGTVTSSGSFTVTN